MFNIFWESWFGAPAGSPGAGNNQISLANVFKMEGMAYFLPCSNSAEIVIGIRKNYPGQFACRPRGGGLRDIEDSWGKRIRGIITGNVMAGTGNNKQNKTGKNQRPSPHLIHFKVCKFTKKGDKEDVLNY